MTSPSTADADLLRIEHDGALTHVRLNRPAKRNAVSDALIARLQGLAKAVELASKVATNAPLSNFAVMHALPRIGDLSQADGLFVESPMAAIAQGDEAAKLRVRAFLEGRAGKVGKS